MLDGYVSEKEQIESIRKWWDENGKFILIAIIIGLGVGMAWKYWHNLQARYAENAAMLYQSILNADEKDNIKTVTGGATLLMQHFPLSPYASMAALVSAKELVMQNNYSAALTNLQWIIKNGNVKRLQQIARLNAARILLAEQKPQMAMQIISVVNDKQFEPLIEWIKGDIFTAEKNTLAAHQAYEKAKTGFAGFPPAEAVMTKELAN